MREEMIYLWKLPKDYSDKLVATYNRELSPDRFLFLDGDPLTTVQINKKIIFDVEVNKNKVIPYDCMLNNSSIPLVNERVVDVLLKLAPSDVQFFNTEVRCKDGILLNYKLLNVTNKIIGIDHEKSIYSMIENTDAILGFKYLTYKPGCMDNYKLARDGEYLGNILLTEEIKQAFECEKIKGQCFVTPEEYYLEEYDDDGRRVI